MPIYSNIHCAHPGCLNPASIPTRLSAPCQPCPADEGKAHPRPRAPNGNECWRIKWCAVHWCQACRLLNPGLDAEPSTLGVGNPPDATEGASRD
ncbi:hypothetical protein IAU60_006161 [Kwoniella sp. DSM 27419]